MIGQSNGGLAQALRSRSQITNRNRPIKEGKLTVNVEMNEGQIGPEVEEKCLGPLTRFFLLPHSFLQGFPQ